MVQEFRRLELSKDELVAALEAHNQAVPGFLPAGKIFGIDILEEDNLEITFAVFADDYEMTARMAMRASRVLIPVLRFCIENNVWLPSQGRKLVEITPHSVVLCIEIDSESDVDLGEPLRLSRAGTR